MSRFRLLGVLFAPLTCLLIMDGCSGFDRDNRVTASTSLTATATARALVVGDEPFAVRAGSAVLAQGGNAADAATAMFFALSVTYPVAAGAGGGGICLTRQATGIVTEFDFLPRAASRGGAYAVPGAVRGFFDLQKRFGVLPWQRDVAPAEALADAGFPISAALESRLAGTENTIRLDPMLAGEFLDESGGLKRPGTVVTNHAYAHTLATIRQTGADGFAKTVGESLIAYSGTLTADDFASAATRQSLAARRILGQFTLSYPAAGTGAGAYSAALLSRIGDASSASAGTVSLAAAKDALTNFGAVVIPADLGSTGFSVLDANGAAVTCAVTMNGPFGSARTVPDTGTLLASAPSGTAGLASAFLMPLIATIGQTTRFAGAAAGGPNGAAAITYALLRAAGGARVAAPADIRSTGAAPRDTINLIVCQDICVPLPDPGGHGLGASGDPIADAAP
jgi:gamma-glutamyltranspeptidase/glutathione hydrolase